MSKAPGLAKMQPVCATAGTILCVHFTTDDQLSVSIIIGGIVFGFGFVVLICYFISDFVFGVLFGFSFGFGFIFGFIFVFGFGFIVLI